MKAVLAAVAFGSNLGDRAQQIEAALAALAAHDGVDVLAVSRCLETRPVGGPPQGDFLNGAVLLRTILDPRGLLELLHHLERRAGRVREGSVPNAPRPLDLDLLLHGDSVLDEPGLTVPHPRMHTRAFVLDPLLEVAPSLVHPVLGASVGELHAALHDTPSDQVP